MTTLNTERVITALITPMTENGALDFNSLSQMIHLQEAAGNAVLLLGSTGEGLALSLAEKKQVLQHVFGLKPKVAVMVGVGGFQLEEQLAWIEYCQTHYPLAGFLLVTPLYAKPGVQGQIAWFKALLDAATVPCILYNVPGRSAVKLHFPVIEALVGHPRFVGLKEASGNIEEFAEYQRLMKGLPVYSGNDEMLASQVSRGAFGMISIASNIWPREASAYLEQCLNAKNTTDLDQIWEDASNALFLASNPIPIKVLCAREGLIASATLRPPLTHLDLSETQIQKLCSLSKQVREVLA